MRGKGCIPWRATDCGVESQMRTNITEPAEVDSEHSARIGRRQTREIMRDAALRNAIRKRAEGVPTYTVPDASALLSISQEYRYRLIQADSLPAYRLWNGLAQAPVVAPS